MTTSGPGPYPGDRYETPAEAAAPVSSMFPNLSFYIRMCSILKDASSSAKHGTYSDEKWIGSSLAIRQAMEKCGTRMTIEGLEHFKGIDGPCVFVGNHMSTLETFMLPGMIQPYKPVAFVVKESLLNYPFFRHVMRSRNPIVVQRQNPRADFAAVMEGGMQRLADGISVIIFPQSTRRLGIDREAFNSMGVKLAKKAGVPIIPLALRTDAWGMGGLFGLLKDHGPIRPAIPVNYRFGKPLMVQGNGKAEHEAVYSFIEKALAEWGMPPLSAATALSGSA